MTRGVCYALLALLVTGCVTVAPAPPSAADEGALARALVALAPNVDAAEAAALASAAYRASRDLTEQYGMARVPELHNVMVNVGLRERGLCCDWARDMLQRLTAVPVKSFTLHWVTAYEGQIFDEHNSALIAPRGGGLADGIVIDGWRSPGKLVWVRATEDRYPWRLHSANPNWQRVYCAIERRRSNGDGRTASTEREDQPTGGTP